VRFLLSEDQNALFQAISDYANDQCDGGVRRTAFEGDGFHPEFWAGLMELGVGGVVAPEEHGGLGLGLVEAGLAVEALGYAGAPGPILGHLVAVRAIAALGSDAQKQRWLPQLSPGKAIATVALTEPDERFGPDQWTSQVSNGRLAGDKRDVLCSEIADVTLVGIKGGFALVERDAAGQTHTAVEPADRTRRFAHVAYDGVAADLMPASDEDAAAVMDAAYVLICADAFGGARRLLDMSADYAKTREQFGQPIGRFQGLKHQLANMATEVEPARGLYWYAAHAQDIQADDRRRVAALAKAHLGDVFMQAGRVAVEAHGGIGFTWDYDAQIWFKRAMFDFAYLGAPSRHRDRAAALAGW
jgi:alkylation response protein AidB-like acyl-CoA dehydrogenase